MIKRYKVGPRMSQAVVGTPTVFLAGQVADDQNAGVEEQTRQVLAKIDALLAEAGTDKSRLLSVAVYLPNIADFAAMNSVYDTWIDKQNPAARACVEARLAAPGLRVEIVAIASA